MSSHQTILILDFGSQFTQLIARRVRENRVYCEIHPYNMSIDDIVALDPIGIILSGGPNSVYDDDAPAISPEMFALGIPLLGICYGMQLIAHHLGGAVEAAGEHEYGRADIDIAEPGLLFRDLETTQPVWASHGDRIVKVPEGFSVTASSDNAPVVAMEHADLRIFGIQFHPEVSHTTHGVDMLRNFLLNACRAAGDWQITSFVEESVARVRDQVGNGRVVCALSGGVDSAVMALLLKKALPTGSLRAIFVDNGLLRKNEAQEVIHSLRQGLGLDVLFVDARREFLTALEGIRDPELKRRIIGRVFVEIFKKATERLDEVAFLAQGTLYPDVIESVSVKGPSAVIKTHHNVGGLPEELGFELVEPLRFLFKDEVRDLGRELGLPESFVRRHPFPGPGLGVRILGEITPERIAVLQEADAIFIDELRRADHYDRVSQAFAVFLPVRSVGVMGDGRTYENVIALRSADTFDFMTADWSPLPYDLLGRAANRIVNEVRGVNRVVYDITSKPPGTIEWE